MYCLISYYQRLTHQIVITNYDQVLRSGLDFDQISVWVIACESLVKFDTCTFLYTFTRKIIQFFRIICLNMCQMCTKRINPYKGIFKYQFGHLLMLFERYFKENFTMRTEIKLTFCIIFQIFHCLVLCDIIWILCYKR